MKSILLNFKDNVLSKEEMKSVKGGKMFYCQCGNLSSTTFSSSNSTTAQAACTSAGQSNGYGSGCTAHAA